MPHFLFVPRANAIFSDSPLRSLGLKLLRSVRQTQGVNMKTFSGLSQQVSRLV